MPSTRTDRTLQAYYPALHFSKLIEYSLEEVETEQEAYRKLDELILKADANVARLAETYRERAMTPGQIRDYRIAQGVISTFSEGQKKSQDARTAFARAPAEPLLKKWRGLRSEDPSKSTDSAMVQTIIDEARKAPEALRAKLVRDAANEIGLNQTYRERIAGALTEGGSYTALMASIDTPESKKKVAAYVSGGAEVPPEVAKALALTEATESPYAHGRKDSTMSPTQESLRDRYVRSLQTNGGKANPDDFASMEQMEAAEAAYLQARTDQNYAAADAEWYAEDYLRAFQTRQDLVRRKEAGLGYDDPWKEAQKRAFERGGYDLKGMYLAAADPKKHDLIKRSFSLVESMRSGDFKETPLTAKIKELYRQAKAQGITLTQDQLQDKLSKFYRDESTSYRRTAQDERRQRRQDVRELRGIQDPETRRAAIRARRDGADGAIWGAEDQMKAQTDRQLAGAYLAALKLQEKIGDTDLSAIQVPYTGPAPMDEVQQAEKDEARVKRETQEQVKAQTATEQAPQPPAPASPPPTPVSEFERPTGPFTDPTDPSSVYEYVPDRNAYVALKGPYAGREFLSTSTAGIALKMAQQAALGDEESLASLKELQDRTIRNAAARNRQASTEIDLSGGGVIDPAKLQAQEAIRARRAELMAAPTPVPEPVPEPTPVPAPVSNPPAEIDDDAFLRGVLEEGQ